MQLTIEITTY